MLEKEFRMTEYFYSKGIGAEVLNYTSDDSDWLLTTAVIGENCTHKEYLMNPGRLCDTIAYELRKLHETDYTGCPFRHLVKLVYHIVQISGKDTPQKIRNL